MIKIKNNQPYFDSINIINFTKKIATPYFIFSENVLITNHRTFLKSFSGYPNLRIDYSVKTNNEIAVLKILKKEGVCLEISCGYELELAEIAGFLPAQMTYDGPVKSIEDITLALNKGINAFYVDSLDDAKRIETVAKKLKKAAPIGLRLNLGIKSILSGIAETYIGKFGIPYADLTRYYQQINRSKYLKLIALSTHLGSQILTPKPYLKAIKTLADLANQLIKNGAIIREISLGGGFPSRTLIKTTLPQIIFSAFDLPFRDRVTPLSEFGAKISLSFSQQFKKFPLLKPTLVLQPGRYISGNMGIIVARVCVVKKNWIFLDVSTSSLPESIFFARREILVANKINLKPNRKYFVAGAGLNSADNFGRFHLPEVIAGDIVIILDAGAYSISRSNRFTVLNPPIYMITATGRTKLIRRKETYEDIIGPMEF